MNQKGIAHLLIIVLILAGIIVGLFLVKNPQIFQPKAYTTLSTESPVTVGMTYTDTSFATCDLNAGGTNNGFGQTNIIMTYDQPGVRDKVKSELARMRASGIQSLDLLVWYAHTPQTSTRTYYIPSMTNRVEEPYRTNFINYLKDIKEADYQRILITMGPQAGNLPGQETYDPNLLGEDWNFLKDVRSLVKQNGPADSYFDILPEAAAYTDDQRLQYARYIWINYVQTFGKADAVISFVVIANDGGVDDVVNMFNSTGMGQPNWYQFSFYPYYDSPEYALSLLDSVDQKLTAHGITTAPLILREGWYNNASVAQAIAEFNRTHNRKITDAFSWYLSYFPGVGGPAMATQCGVSPPYSMSEYVSRLPQTASQISASPNPCILNDSGVCTSTITWNFSNNPDVKITVRENPGSLFAQAPYGSQAAPWISGSGSTFDVYSGTQLLKSISVKGIKNSPSPSPSPSRIPVDTPIPNPMRGSADNTTPDSGPQGIACTHSVLSNGTVTDSCPSGYACDNSGGTGCTNSYPSGSCYSSGVCVPAGSSRGEPSETPEDNPPGPWELPVNPPFYPLTFEPLPSGFPAPSDFPSSPPSGIPEITSGNQTQPVSIICRIGQVNRVIGSLLGCVDSQNN